MRMRDGTDDCLMERTVGAAITAACRVHSNMLLLAQRVRARRLALCRN